MSNINPAPKSPVSPLRNHLAFAKTAQARAKEASSSVEEPNISFEENWRFGGMDGYGPGPTEELLASPKEYMGVDCFFDWKTQHHNPPKQPFKERLKLVPKALIPAAKIAGLVGVGTTLFFGFLGAPLTAALTIGGLMTAFSGAMYGGLAAVETLCTNHLDQSDRKLLRGKLWKSGEEAKFIPEMAPGKVVDLKAVNAQERLVGLSRKYPYVPPVGL